MQNKTVASVYSDHIQAARDTGNYNFLEVLELEIESSTMLSPADQADLLNDVYEALAFVGE